MVALQRLRQEDGTQAGLYDITRARLNETKQLAQIHGYLGSSHLVRERSRDNVPPSYFPHPWQTRRPAQ